MKIKSLEEQQKDIKDLDLYRLIDKHSYFYKLQSLNKLGIEKIKTLEIIERKITKQKMDNLKEENFNKMNLRALLEIHKYIFGDIYYFAGQIRDMPMQINNDTKFSRPGVIQIEINNYFNDLEKDNYLKNIDKKQFVKKTATYLTRINKIHPFREGNERTKRVFFSILSQQAGYKLDWSKNKAEDWKKADIESFKNFNEGKEKNKFLEKLLENSIQKVYSKELIKSIKNRKIMNNKNQNSKENYLGME